MKKYFIKTKICYIFVFVFCTSFHFHKFYVSVTQCDYVPSQKSLQITIRIFMDDLQEEINFLKTEKIELATEREPKNVNEIYKKYLERNLQFFVNGHLKKFEYIGKKYKGNTAIFFLEITSIEKIAYLKLKNTILIQTIKQQKNIVQTKIYNQKKSFVFSKDEKIKQIF